MQLGFFDSHAHYDDEKFDIDREELINSLYKNGITNIVSAGYSIKSSINALELANKYPQIYTTCGISPNDIQENVENAVDLKSKIEILNKIAINANVVAIGEIGLDYYWNKENKDEQKQYFVKQIELANALELPIVIHTREAIQDTLDILKQNVPNRRGVFHCCPLNRELVKEALKLGFYISFCGPVTFKNSKNADEIIQMVPNDMMLIETDSPYLSPEPNRGKRNDSSNLVYIAKKIAQVKNLSVEDVAKITYDNTCRLFNINIGVNDDIVRYVESEVLPLYKRNDLGHNIEHVRQVVRRSLEIIDDNNLDVNKNIAYVISAYHDLGCYKDRKTHEKISAQIFMEDEKIKSWFSEDEIVLIKEGIEDHRASSNNEPRSIYGKIVTTADKERLNIDKLIVRIYKAYMAKQGYLELDKEEQISEIYNVLMKKYSESGYIKVWIEDKKYLDDLCELRKYLTDKESCIERIRNCIL